MPLPSDVLAKRVNNEVRECKRAFEHHFTVMEPGLPSFPVTLQVKLVNTPGPVMDNGQVHSRYTHMLTVTVTESYPYQTPIARWRSPIFHPNIMPPKDGGYICTKLLDEWTFRSNLPAFIRGIESLLLNPNPDDPYDNDTCTRAAAYFNSTSYTPPVTAHRKSHTKPVILSDNDKNHRGNTQDA